MFKRMVCVVVGTVLLNACPTDPGSSEDGGTSGGNGTSSAGYTTSSSMGVIRLSSSSPTSTNGRSTSHAATSQGASSTSESGGASSSDQVVSSSTGAGESSSAAQVSSSTSQEANAPLVADPPAIDFGVLPMNSTVTQLVHINNVTAVDQVLGTMVVTTSPASGATVVPNLDGVMLAAGEQVTVVVSWTQLGLDQVGTILIPVENSNGFQLEIHLNGTSQLEQAHCMCPGPITAHPQDTVNVVVDCVDPNSDIDGYQWTYEQNPEGVSNPPVDTATPTTQVVVNQEGDYVLRLTATDVRGDPWDSCTVTIHVVPPALCECPASVVTRVGTPVNLTSTCTDAAGELASYAWSVQQHPANSTAQPNPNNALSTTFQPDQSGDYRLQFSAHLANGEEAASCTTDVRANPPPTCTCPAPIQTRPLATVVLAPTCTDVAGELKSYAWTVAQRPTGSTSQPIPGNALTTTFFVDLAGDYRLTFAARMQDGTTAASCNVDLHSVPPQNLHIQLVWDTDKTDVDLHLLGPNGGNYFALIDPASDCFYDHRRAAWGTASLTDDATLDIDDVNGYGPENINIVNPMSGTYTVGVHYYCDDNGTHPTKATVRIYCEGTLREEFQRRMVDMHDFWDVATVRWPECTIVENTAANRRVAEGECGQ